MRIRVYLDRTDRLWRVCGVHPGPDSTPADVAAEVQRHRGGHWYPTWVEAMAAAERLVDRARLREVAWVEAFIAAREAGVTPPPKPARWLAR